jgi:V/A-type H+-transporting ATPase subunit E
MWQRTLSAVDYESERGKEYIEVRGSLDFTGGTMAFENLIEAVEVSAEEKIREIREKADKEGVELKKDAGEKAGVKQKAALEDAWRRVRIEKNILISSAKKENQMEFIVEKDRIFQRAFQEAGKRLVSTRVDPQYEKSLKALILETLQELKAEELIVHIDQRDEALCRKLLRDLQKNCEIMPDLECAGGLNVTTKDGRYIIYNTFDSRLEKAKKVLKSEIYSTLFGA